jgi:nucleoside-diphosphate-sugar epimerase
MLKSGKTVLVTGACGYKGSVLTPKLLERGYHVIALDLQWFGNHLAEHPNLSVIKGDVRNTASIDLSHVDAIVHLASIANDPCGDLDPKLTWEVSALATMQLLDAAKRNGVKHFVYASSGSVYGVKREEQVTEELSLEPISEYNKTKMVAERVVLSYAKDMSVSIIRPATVCGISKRMRLDVSVNMLTMQALSKGKITVFGGEQVRPNIHIDDITNLYLAILHAPSLYSGIFNAGFENLSILDIANLVQQKVPCEIEITASSDPRSYRINSDKLLKTGFKPGKTVSDAIDEIRNAYARGELLDEPNCYNLAWMQKEVFR